METRAGVLGGRQARCRALKDRRGERCELALLTLGELIVQAVPRQARLAAAASLRPLVQILKGWDCQPRLQRSELREADLLVTARRRGRCRYYVLFSRRSAACTKRRSGVRCM